VRGGGTATLILAGVAVSSFLGSVQAFVMQSSSADVKRVYSWLFGDFSSADWSLVRLALPYAPSASSSPWCTPSTSTSSRSATTRPPLSVCTRPGPG